MAGLETHNNFKPLESLNIQTIHSIQTDPGTHTVIHLYKYYIWFAGTN